MKNGTYAIRNVRTGRLDYSPAYGSLNSSVDLAEDEELMVWNDAKEGGAGFVHVDPGPTEFEKIVLDIRAFIEAIDEKMDDLENLNDR